MTKRLKIDGYDGMREFDPPSAPASKTRGQEIVKPATDYARLDRRDELQIVRKPAKVVGYTAAPIVTKPTPRRPDSDTARLLKLVDQDLGRAWSVLQRLPHGGQYVSLKTSGSGALAAKWLETYIDHNVDYGTAELEHGVGGVRIKHKPPRVRPAGPSPAEVTWMDRMFDLIIGVDSRWLRRLLWLRAARTPWGDIAAIDDQRRSVRRQQQLHRAALINMLGVWLALTHKK